MRLNTKTRRERKPRHMLFKLFAAFALTYTFSCFSPFTYTDSAYAASAVSISTLEKSMSIGDTYKITFNGVTDAKATYKYTSSNTSVATVAADGTVTARAAGQSYVTCKIGFSDGTSKSFYCIITVTNTSAFKSISFTNQNLNYYNAQTLSAGSSYSFSAAISPVTSAYKIFWFVDDTAYASVTQDGIVTALKPGVTKLTAAAGVSLSDARNASGNWITSIYLYIQAAGTGGYYPSLTPTPTPIYTSPSGGGTAAIIASKNATVTSVKGISSTTVEITFSKPVNPDYIIKQLTQSQIDEGVVHNLTKYISIAPANYGEFYALEVDELVGTLSEDCTVLTIKSPYGYFSGNYTVYVSGSIKTKDGNYVTGYTEVIDLTDTTGPRYVDSTTDLTGYICKINFSEEIVSYGMSIESVTCTNATAKADVIEYLKDPNNYYLSDDERSLCINLTDFGNLVDGKKFQVVFNEIYDTMYNHSVPSLITATFGTNTAYRGTSQIVSVERTGQYVITATFDQPILFGGSVTIKNNMYSGEVDTENPYKVNYVLDFKPTGSQTLYFSGWFNYFGNLSVTNSKVMIVDMSITGNPPILMSTSASYTSASQTVITLNYDTRIAIAKSSGTVSMVYYDTYGGSQNITAKYTSSSSGTAIKLYINDGVMSAAGTYVLTLPVKFAMDTLGNYTAACTVPLSLSGDSLTPLPAPSTAWQDPSDLSVIYLSFRYKVDEATAEDVNNYVLGSYTSPATAELVSTSGSSSQVKLTFLPGTIAYTTTYPLYMSGIRGANNSFGAMELTSLEVKLTENVPPVFKKAYFYNTSTIALQFDEQSEISGYANFKVYYNNTDIYSDYSIDSYDKIVYIYLSRDIVTGYVTVIPAISSYLQDENYNRTSFAPSYMVIYGQ